VLLYNSDIWLHVSTTSGHPQAVKVYKIYEYIKIYCNFNCIHFNGLRLTTSG
jgi:uncharacterized protein YutD